MAWDLFVFDTNDFEAIDQERLRQPDSVTVFRYRDCAILEIETSADCEAAEKDLQDLEVCGCAVSKPQFAPKSIQAAAPTDAVSTTASDSAPTAPAPALIALATTAATPTAIATTSVIEEVDGDLGWAVSSEDGSNWEAERPKVEYED
ncbi:hypothetical protein J3F84DRAFT_345508 [Trichoderma pleuroticola]